MSNLSDKELESVNRDTEFGDDKFFIVCVNCEIVTHTFEIIEEDYDLHIVKVKLTCDKCGVVDYLK